MPDIVNITVVNPAPSIAEVTVPALPVVVSTDVSMVDPGTPVDLTVTTPAQVITNVTTALVPPVTEIVLTDEGVTGVNTGDETTATIKSKLGITTLSGSNTGDQDLAAYATTASLSSYALTSSLGTLATQNGTFSGTSSGTNTGDQNLSGYALTSSLGTLATQNGTFSGTSSGTNTGDQSLAAYATTANVAAGYQPLNNKLTAVSLLTNSAGVLTNDGTGIFSYAAAGSGTVTSVSVTTANGVSGSVATSTVTPAITISLGAITPTSVAASGGVTGSNLSGTNTGDNAANTTYASDYRAANFVAGTDYLAPTGSAAALTSFPTLNQNTSGTAAGLSAILTSTTGGSGVNNAGTLTWGAGGTLGTAAYTASGAYQPIDADLTTIAGLTATTDNFIQSKGSAWTSRTVAEVKTDLGLTGTNTGDNAANTLYSGLVSNATHTGDVTGSVALTLVNIPALSGANLTTLNASNISTGTVAADRLGSAGGAGKYLRYDNTWQTLAGGGDAVVAGTIDQFADVTQTAGQTLAITASTTLSGGTHSGTNTGDNSANSLYSGLVSNATHTGDVTGATALTIANDAVTYAKIQNVTAASKLLGRGSAAGAGDAEEITVGSGLTMTGTTLSASSGSDPWTYVKVTTEFSTTSATAVDVIRDGASAVLGFTPAANTDYEFEALLYTRTPTTATVGVRPGLAWPTGLTNGVAELENPTSATAVSRVFGNSNAALLAAVGGLPNTTQSYPARVRGHIRAGASPSGLVRIQCASETAATAVRIEVGSFIRYRTT